MVTQYINCGTKIGKYQETILVDRENQLDLCFPLGQSYVKLKVTCQCGHVYNMLLSNLPLGLENILKNRDFKDSDLLEK